MISDSLPGDLICLLLQDVHRLHLLMLCQQDHVEHSHVSGAGNRILYFSFSSIILHFLSLLTLYLEIILTCWL